MDRILNFQVIQQMANVLQLARKTASFLFVTLEYQVMHACLIKMEKRGVQLMLMEIPTTLRAKAIGSFVTIFVQYMVKRT